MQDYKRLRFIAAVIGMFLVPFLILSHHFADGNRELQKTYTLRYLEMRTSAGARIVADVLNTTYNLSRLTADKNFAKDRRGALAKKVNDSPFIYSELVLLGRSGGEVLRVPSAKKGVTAFDYGKSQVFAEAKKTAQAAGAVEYGAYTPPALLIAEPVGGAGAAPEYYIAGRLSLAYLGELVRLMGKNSHGNMGLVDAGGQIMADSMNLSTRQPGILAPQEISGVLAAAIGNELGGSTREVRGRTRSYLVSVANVPGSKWWFYEIMDTKAMPAYNAPYHASRIIGYGILVIILLGLITWKLADLWLVHPEVVAAVEQETRP